MKRETEQVKEAMRVHMSQLPNWAKESFMMSHPELEKHLTSPRSAAPKPFPQDESNPWVKRKKEKEESSFQAD